MELMKTSYEGLELIRRFEGCKLKAYKPVPTEKYYTIGYGHYGPDVKQGMTITASTAEELLHRDVLLIEMELNTLGINFMQQQFDALVSWVYNLGTGSFRNSTMKKYIVAGKPDYDITDQMVKWVNSNGKPLLGLMRRRVAEANMWLGGDIYRIENNKITRR
jgi:GH24 family phage-related lysozyme (muramidase)